MIGQSPLETMHEKTGAIESSPGPLTTTQVKAFIGLTGFYGRFVSNSSAVVILLTDLTKKTANKVIWTESQEKAFTTLKRILSSDTVLMLLGLAREIIPYTDACETRIGAVLLQGEGIKRHIDYISKKLLNRERNYSMIKKSVSPLFGRYKNSKNFCMVSHSFWKLITSF